MESQYSVFIIDDDHQLSNDLTHLFESIHYEVTCFTKTKEYLHFLSTHTPALACVLSEFKKSSISGLELLNHLKTKHQKIYF